MRARFVKVVRDLTARKRAEERMQQEYVREHRIARTLQNTLLPQFSEDAFPGFAVAAFYEPAWEESLVGGDFYDVVPLRDDKIAFVVGDVAGKGLSAATRTGELKAALRAFLRERPDPVAALSRLNNLVCDAEQLDGVDEHLLAVVALAVVESKTGDAIFASAGLEAPILARGSGQIEAVPVHGLTLGVMRDIAYQPAALRLGEDDLLMMTTDGLTEARRGREFLGHEGLMQILQKTLPRCSPRAIGGATLEAVREFTSGTQGQSALQDDACLLLARRLPI